MKFFTRWYFVLFMLVAILAIAFSSLRPSGEEGVAESPAAGDPAVEIRHMRGAYVQERNLPRVLETIGSLEPYELTTIKAKVDGRLEKVFVDLGSVVESGDEIAQIEQADYQLRLSQAEAQLDQARARLGMQNPSVDTINLEQLSIVREAQAMLSDARQAYERVAPLAQSGVASDSELEEAQTALQLAESRLDAALEEARYRVATLTERQSAIAIAQQQLNDAVLRAPFDGIVQQRWAHTGEYLDVGDEVATLVRMDAVRLRLEVPERLAPLIQPNQPIEFTLENNPGQYTTTVQRISPVIESMGRVLVVEADVQNEGALRPGAFARARIIITEDDPTLIAPITALSSFAGLHKIFVVEDGQAVETNVTLGRRGDDWVEVTGVEAGQVVVLNPGNLRSGTMVEIEIADDTL